MKPRPPSAVKIDRERQYSTSHPNCHFTPPCIEDNGRLTTGCNPNITLQQHHKDTRDQGGHHLEAPVQPL